MCAASLIWPHAPPVLDAHVFSHIPYPRNIYVLNSLDFISPVQARISARIARIQEQRPVYDLRGFDVGNKRLIHDALALERMFAPEEPLAASTAIISEFVISRCALILSYLILREIALFH